MHIRAPGAAGVKARDFAFLKFDNTVGKREKSVIFALPDIFSRANRGAALTHNNLAGVCQRAVGEFDT